MHKIENSEAFSQYLNDIKCYNRLSLSREKYLSLIITDKISSKELKEKCIEELIECNLKLVVKIATSCFKKIMKLEDANVSLMDLIQYGNIGLIKAARKYKWNSKTRFGTYAYVSIERNIISSIKDSRMIRIPYKYFKYMKEIDNITVENDSISDKDLADKIDVNEKTLNNIKNNRNSKVSIENISYLIDQIVSNEPSAYKIVSEKHDLQYLYKIINELKPRHKKVLYYRYLNNKEMSLSEIGKKLGITREAVRSIEKKAIINLKRKISNKT